MQQSMLRARIVNLEDSLIERKQGIHSNAARTLLDHAFG
jgi:hypothetical protein